MRTATILSVAVGAIAVTFMTPVPRASAITTAAPAAIDQAAPSNMVEKVRTVCRRYRVRYHGRWVWRTRCYHTPNYYRPYAPPPPFWYYPRPYRY